MKVHSTGMVSEAGTPSVVGTGFIALDVILEEGAPAVSELRAGGTCGNVLAILSFLGWSAYPVGRMNGDRASKVVREDFKECGVKLDFVSMLPGTDTPVVVQHLFRTPTGERKHSFSWECPLCGSELPRYRAVHVAAVKEMAVELAPPNVYFADRVSPASLVLARATSANGSLVVFEPSSVGEPNLFREMLSLAHVVKFSSERLKQLPELLDEVTTTAGSVRLEIETRGKLGLRYRLNSANCAPAGWKVLRAFQSENVVDTCGAGDWATAMLVSKLGAWGAKGFSSILESELLDALICAQAAGTWSCAYIGARGAMYRETKAAMERDVKNIIAGRPWCFKEASKDRVPISSVAPIVCANCNRIDRNLRESESIG